MSHYIGHCRIDERGKARGGQAGDQNGQEIRVQKWYNGGWGFLARPRRKEVADAIANACEAGCRNDNLGYDQNGRNTGLQEAQKVNWDLSKILTPCEFDCSSYVTCCVMAGGVQIWSGGNAPTTRTLRKVLQQSGEFEILTDEKYLMGTDYLLRGDVLCKENNHTVISLTDGEKASRNAADETFDETKNELRSAATYTVTLPLVKKGDRGPIVKTIQTLLIGQGYILEEYGADGDFGKETKKMLEIFQDEHGLEKDGEVGVETWGALLGLTGVG